MSDGAQIGITDNLHGDHMGTKQEREPIWDLAPKACPRIHRFGAQRGSFLLDAESTGTHRPSSDPHRMGKTNVVVEVQSATALKSLLFNVTQRRQDSRH